MNRRNLLKSLVGLAALPKIASGLVINEYDCGIKIGTPKIPKCGPPEIVKYNILEGQLVAGRYERDEFIVYDPSDENSIVNVYVKINDELIKLGGEFGIDR